MDACCFHCSGLQFIYRIDAVLNAVASWRFMGVFDGGFGGILIAHPGNSDRDSIHIPQRLFPVQLLL